jgi:hypothetical protein
MTTTTDLKTLTNNSQGKVAVPVLLYVLGVPGLVCILLWLFIFKGA